MIESRSVGSDLLFRQKNDHLRRRAALGDSSGVKSKLDFEQIFPMGSKVWIKIRILNTRCCCWRWNLCYNKNHATGCQLAGKWKNYHGIYHLCHHEVLNLREPRRQTAQFNLLFRPGVNDSAWFKHREIRMSSLEQRETITVHKSKTRKIMMQPALN